MKVLGREVSRMYMMEALGNNNKIGEVIVQNYLVQEIQTNNGTMATWSYIFNNLDDAMAKFYSVLAYNYTARALDLCSVVVLDEMGQMLKCDQYIKRPDTEASPDPIVEVDEVVYSPSVEEPVEG